MVSIVSQRHSVIERLDELKAVLLTRLYRPKIVDENIKKALSIPSLEALEKVEKKQNDRLVFVSTYHPALMFKISTRLQGNLFIHWSVLICWSAQY